jgi:hypothetical protein
VVVVVVVVVEVVIHVVVEVVVVVLVWVCKRKSAIFFDFYSNVSKDNNSLLFF